MQWHAAYYTCYSNNVLVAILTIFLDHQNLFGGYHGYSIWFGAK